MSTRNYLILCGGVVLVWVLLLLFVPPFAEAIESLLLLFLSTQAR